MKRWLVWSLVACAGSAPAPQRVPVAPPAPLVAPPAPVTIVPEPPRPVQQFAAADPGFGFADPDRRSKLATAFPKLDAAIAEEMAAQGVPGLALGIVIDGELAYAKGYGVVDPAGKTAPDADTVYRIGSISKSFTGLAILALRDAGTLTLDDPLVRWIPEASGLVYLTHDSPPITLRQLLTHTSGLPRDVDFTRTATEPVFLAQLAGLALDNPPGRAFVYSNLGFALLGIVVARASHATLPEVLAKRVFGPLGMTSTAYAPAGLPPGHLAPAFVDSPEGRKLAPNLEALGVAAGAGGIFSTVRDMARYLALQLSAYPPRSDAETGPVRRATIREAHATGFLTGGSVSPRPDAKRGEPAVRFGASSYGFGWGHEVSCLYDDVVEHNGAIDSHRAAVEMLTSHGVGVIVLTNFGNANTSGFVERAIDALAATGGLVAYTAHPTLAPGFEPTMQKLLAVYNQWDEAAFAALLSRPPDPVEHDELAGYHKLHGNCSAVAPIEALSSLQARFQLTCERGAFELLAAFAPDGRLAGFIGTSRHVAVPAEVTAAGKTVLALLAHWDDKLFARAFADPATLHDLLKRAGAQLFAETGACKPTEFIHEAFDWRFEATCDKGPARRFDLKLDGAKLKGVFTRPLAESTCPLK